MEVPAQSQVFVGLSDAALCGVTLHTVCVAIGNCTERESILLLLIIIAIVCHYF